MQAAGQGGCWGEFVGLPCRSRWATIPHRARGRLRWKCLAAAAPAALAVGCAVASSETDDVFPAAAAAATPIAASSRKSVPLAVAAAPAPAASATARLAPSAANVGV